MNDLSGKPAVPFFIDPGGIVRLHHVGEGPADRPTVTQIMQVVDQSPAQIAAELLTT